MAGSPLIDRERDLLTLLETLSAERDRAEAETARAFKARREEEERAYQANRSRVMTTAKADIQSLRAKHEAARQAADRAAEAESSALSSEYEKVKKGVASKAQAIRNATRKALEDARWQVLALYEASKDGAIKQFKVEEAQTAVEAERLDGIKDLAAPVLARCARFVVTQVPAEMERPADPLEALKAANQAAGERLVPLDKLFLPRFLAPSSFVWPFLLIGLALAYPLGVRLGWGVGGTIAGVTAVSLAVAAWLGLAKVARGQLARLYPLFALALAEAERLVEATKVWSKANFEAKKTETEVRRDRDTKAAEDRASAATREADERRHAATAEADATYPPRLTNCEERHQAALKRADETYLPQLSQVETRARADVQAIDAQYRATVEATKAAHARAWEALETRWRDGLKRAEALAAEVNGPTDRDALDWHGTPAEAWAPPAAVPDGLRFGRFTVDLADIPQGVPADPRLKAHGPTSFDLPALVPFPDRGSVLIKVQDAGKPEAVRLLQTLMLRYATSLPPGKVRFTIIDPVGLGENFAAFMHLADYSELLVNSRIWTEAPHIEQRLADLSAHMENVIQKYLRNEFESIEAYNAFAGEVAEPFRVLVVANFPANFSESAARRLLSIAASGARCGVYTLISVDAKQTLPTGIQMKELEAVCVNLTWREGKLHWREPALGRFPLRLDAPPDPETFTRLMHTVGDLARNANKVEVPFEFIAPRPDQYWTADSRAGVDVPLGRAGATKVQSLKLGKGTSQHVLTAGKTGSGKSTLLHALITNAALRYSPDEVELYLIDFKKGVEFKVYAALELPHARVIAVESEREFGLSVLQRLDAELKVRGDRFRDLGVQDLNGYREATGGNPPLPRILFIVDEFQEFFVEDDKVAQEVALLLDRMVRQGRAFGIHVILGSQTLSGAYSLARSTLGQMAVRIALQCSEADAHLILSEENSAARLLTRPGEAIYNDANGLVEGNNFFQVVLLSDERREFYLRQLKDLAKARNRPPAAQIVFEGNLPAVPAKNHLLAGLLGLDGWPESPKADQAWLGEAIAIKDPTAALFRPQSGSNLLIVGQNDAMAVGIATMAAISLAAQHDPAGVALYLLDGTPADAPLHGQLGAIAGVLPHPVRNVAGREVAAVLTELAAEVERRQRGEAGPEAPNLYLFVHDLQRFRDLRKSDDDFGFSRYGEEKATPPAKLFANVLRDGPPLGVHTVVWCDSLNNLNRTLDRQSLREFEMRVLFQMSANDSSSLIDNPTASRLGPNRALFFSEEEGRLEKFRPYGLPSADWLRDAVQASLAARPVPVPPEPIAPAVTDAIPTEAGTEV